MNENTENVIIQEVKDKNDILEIKKILSKVKHWDNPSCGFKDNNYICFGTNDKSTCTSNPNTYRKALNRTKDNYLYPLGNIEGLYKEYVPKKYNCEDVINYQWYQNQDYNYQGKFNFYHIISKNQVSKKSMLLYMILLLTIGVLVDFIYDVFKFLLELIIRG